MAGKKSINYPPNDELAARVTEIGVNRLAAELGISPAGLRAHLVREGLPTRIGEEAEQPTSFTIEVDDLPASSFTPEGLLRSHGLDPEKWRIVRVRANRWGEEEDPKVQLRVDVEPIEAPFVLPNPDDYEPLPTRKRPKRDPDDPETVLIVSDHHAPHHSRPFHRCLVEFIRDEFEAGRLDRIEVNGDLLDASGPAGGGLTRHEVIPGSGYDSSLNEGLDAAFGILRDYREAAPDIPGEDGKGVRIVLKRGNHDERIEKALLSNGVAALYRVRPAKKDEEEEVPALSLRRLLHLDYLGVEYIDEVWDRAESRINRRLTTIHGYSTSRQAGKVLLDSLSGSSLQGHTHRLSLLYRTTKHPDGPEVRVAGEVGCAAEIEDGLGYSKMGVADWQNAAMLAKVWPSGDFALAPLIFLPNPDRLLVPDGRRYLDPGEVWN